MTDPRIYALATLLGAAGMWLMLPRGNAGGRLAGIVLSAAALGVWASRWMPLGDWTTNGLFYTLAGVTIVAAAATVTCRSPIYSAIWFGMSLMGTAALMLLVGAQFLALATVTVYAGAILVTFLFVLLLAQPEGRTAYDRQSWEAMVSATTAAVIVGILSLAVAGVLRSGPASSVTAEQLATGVLDPQHVARLGGELFGRHLAAVEVAGVLLLTALVGASIITTQPKK